MTINCKRIIARIDIKGSRLIKGVRFEGVRVLGDAYDAAMKYYKQGADEILYTDAVASLYGRNGLCEILKRTTKDVFIPITVGGGINTVDNAALLLASGADKIAVNTSIVNSPVLISKLSSAFGSQCVVASIQARKINKEKWEVMTESGRERSGLDVMEWIDTIQALGVGEILLTSVDKDGTCSSPDEDLIKAAEKKAHVPLIVGGGFSIASQVIEHIDGRNISGVCIGAALHYNKLSIDSLKEEISLKTPNIRVRRKNTLSTKNTFYSLKDKKVGIIDYGLGNQQSLKNAFNKLGASVSISDNTSKLERSDILALPGVGAFPEGMKKLKERGLDVFIKDKSQDIPLIGICLGMQMLYEGSEEFGYTDGLALLKGTVQKITSDKPIMLPHIGWNNILSNNSSCHSDLPSESPAQYFVHSYVAKDIDTETLLYKCIYQDISFVAGVMSNSIAGFQFHPERSGELGLQLLGATSLKLLK